MDNILKNVDEKATLQVRASVVHTQMIPQPKKLTGRQILKDEALTFCKEIRQQLINVIHLSYEIYSKVKSRICSVTPLKEATNPEVILLVHLLIACLRTLRQSDCCSETQLYLNKTRRRKSLQSQFNFSIQNLYPLCNKIYYIIVLHPFIKWQCISLIVLPRTLYHTGFSPPKINVCKSMSSILVDAARMIM